MEDDFRLDGVERYALVFYEELVGEGRGEGDGVDAEGGEGGGEDWVGRGLVRVGKEKGGGADILAARLDILVCMDVCTGVGEEGV